MKPVVAVLLRVAAYLLFWGWNTFMMSVLFLGLGPLLFVDLVIAVVRGIVPWQFGAFAAIITVIPLAGSLLAIATRLRSDPGRLLSMFYGVQVPLMFLALTRLFAIHELVASNALVLAVALVGGIATLRTLLHGGEERNGALLTARIAAAACFAALGAWSALVTAILAAPMFGYVVLSIPQWPEFAWNILSSLSDPGDLLVIPMIAVWMFGLLVTLLMFLVMPFAFLGSTARTWQLVHRAGVARWGQAAWAVSIGAVAGLLAGFGVIAQQPQAATFSRIQSAHTDAERAALVADADALRVGLLNARLGMDRYFDGDPDGEFVLQSWEDMVGERIAEGPRAAFLALMKPFAYHPVDAGRVRQRWGAETRGDFGPSLPKDAQTASELYADVFDASMSQAEREALLASATMTWSWQDVQAGLLSVGERKVRLASQEVTTTLDGDLATVRIHDVWRNQGFDREEILLAFDLPDSAAITGLWMGPDPDVSEAFTYIVAPRGAAQEVYEAEVQRRVDPALLESVGPRQYRLRAFPVEPRDATSNALAHFGDEGPDLHVWMEIVVPVRGGSVGMPTLNQARNAFWDGSEARSVDGMAVASDTWVPAVSAADLPPRRHEAIVSGLRVTAEPGNPVPAALGQVDVVIDGSASMGRHREALGEALRQLTGPGVHVWCTREQVLVRCDDFDPARAVFWGHASAGEQIAHRPWTGEALVVLTDAGSYELAAEIDASLATQLPPLWLVHLGGFPSAYPDWTLDRITRSGGGIAGSVPELLAKMGDPAVVDGWRFTVEPAEEGAVATRPSPFDALAARAVIRSLATEQQDSGLSQLDRLHAVAVEHHVISPWSSMIVLVDQAQKDRLKAASEADDRFEREGIDRETFGEDVSAVPEPGTWVLLLLGGGLLAATRLRPAASGGVARDQGEGNTSVDTYT